MGSATKVPIGGIIAAVLLTLSPLGAAHSWVEELMRIAPNGTMVGPPGFIRGYFGRTDPGFTDATDVYLIPPDGRAGGKVLPEDLICKSTQMIGNYSEKYPMLSAAPGDLIALRYQENGHVTRPFITKNKPENRGTIYVYGTANPLNSDTLLAIHKVWTADGRGGDGRGRLLATRNFDDGQCYQINNGTISVARQIQFSKQAEIPQGADLWCQADIRLPADIPTTGTYTLYWVWDWPTMSGKTAASRSVHRRTGRTNSTQSCSTFSPDSGFVLVTPQIYTSCIDIKVIPDGLSNTQPVSFIDQDLNNAAILTQLTDNFLVNVPGADRPCG